MIPSFLEAMSAGSLIALPRRASAAAYGDGAMYSRRHHCVGTRGLKGSVEARRASGELRIAEPTRLLREKMAASVIWTLFSPLIQTETHILVDPFLPSVVTLNGRITTSFSSLPLSLAR